MIELTDNAALLTRYCTQHALGPFFDSEISHISKFIKIQFVNKGIEFIKLPSIFKDKPAISSDLFPHPGRRSHGTIASERQVTSLATLYIGGSVTCSQKKTKGA